MQISHVARDVFLLVLVTCVLCMMRAAIFLL